MRIPFEYTIACSILRPISEVCHIHGFIVILFFSVKSGFICVMGARPSLLCYVHTILARPDIGANAYCHLIGRDDENILSSCINQSDDTIHLLRYLHTKTQNFNKMNNGLNF